MIALALTRIKWEAVRSHMKLYSLFRPASVTTIVRVPARSKARLVGGETPFQKNAVDNRAIWRNDADITLCDYGNIQVPMLVYGHAVRTCATAVCFTRLQHDVTQKGFLAQTLPVLHLIGPHIARDAFVDIQGFASGAKHRPLAICRPLSKSLVSPVAGSMEKSFPS